MKKIFIWVGIWLIILGILWWFSRGPENNLKIETKNRPGQVEIVTKKKLFKLAIMGDIHDDEESLKKALGQAQGDDLVIIAGDLTINGTQKEQESILETLKSSRLNFKVIPGNHDNYKNIWIFGNKYQSFLNSGWKIIMIDNSNWRGLGDGQKKWIENEVKACLVIKCLSVMHIPLVNNFSKHVMGEYSQETASEAIWLKEILLKNNVKTGYSGHLHYSSVYEIDGWQTVLVGAISSQRNTQTSRFTEVSVYDDGSLENEVKIIN